MLDIPEFHDVKMISVTGKCTVTACPSGDNSS